MLLNSQFRLDSIVVADWESGGALGARGISTTRINPDSFESFRDDSYGAFNLALNSEDKNHVLANREKLLKKFNLTNIQWLSQKHSNGVYVIKNCSDVLQESPEADACISFVPNIAVAVLTADCLPILLKNKSSSIVAAVHGGWRSLTHNILEKTCALMGEKSENLIAWLGPCISAVNYEVDAQVFDPIVALDADFYRAFETNRKEKKYQFSLSTLAKLQLAKIGVKNVYGGYFCTFDDLRFYSHRRQGSKRGNMASLTWF